MLIGRLNINCINHGSSVCFRFMGSGTLGRADIMYITGCKLVGVVAEAVYQCVRVCYSTKKCFCQSSQ